MRQVVQNYKSGELALVEVPEPAVKAGGVLVRTLFSLISTGTELMKVNEAGLSMVGKAKARPDQVAKVMSSVASQGPAATYRKVMNKLDSWTPLGYSTCGVVTHVGRGVDDVAVGDLVACAGNEHALHSELNWVPRNLFVPVPAGIDPAHASFATVGAIAMQGVRQSEPALGESALVIGLGLIGQLAARLLVANGVRVIGADLSPARCTLAAEAGAAGAAAPGAELDALIEHLTAGQGVDHVLITAGSADAAPVELAVRHVRDRGRVVDIGKCAMNFPWNASYEKEIEVRFSRSYGPGRYDTSYELEGRDYPPGYVRWTERRNLECFLDLLATGRMDIGSLISHVAEFDTAVETYRSLQSGELAGVAVLFSYPAGAVAAPAVETTRAPAPLPPSTRRPPASRPLRIGFVGAGNYASSMLLPHLTGRQDVELATVATTTALSAANAKEKFGFARACTDSEEIFADDSLAAIFVVTRHSSHPELTARALRTGKAVFVEKPLALDDKGIEQVLEVVRETGNDRLHVGFNRRFAPLLREAREKFGRRSGPLTMRYLVNAGRLEASSWYNRTESEGTRFAGEGGHFLDVLGWFADAAPTSVFATATNHGADLQIVARYADTSTASLIYATSGATSFAKETFEVLGDGKVLRFDDFKSASVHGPDKWKSGGLPKGQDKGQKAQLDAFLRAVATGGPMPIPVESLVATTRATLAVADSLSIGGPVTL